MTPPTPTAKLPADLEAGLKRLKLAAIRRAAPEILLTAKTQRWKPEETLRVLVDLEITARDESNCRNRMNAARFPVQKTLEEFNVDESSIPRATHDYLVTLDWIDREPPPVLRTRTVWCLRAPGMEERCLLGSRPSFGDVPWSWPVRA